MNILHMTTFLQGGAGRIICDLAIEQKKLGHSVCVVTSRTQENDYCNYLEYMRSLNEANITLYEIDSTFKRDLYLNLKVVEKARDIIIDKDIDIIHAHAAIPALVGLISRQASPKYIPVIHSMQGWGTNKTYEQEAADIIIMKGLDRIVVSSGSSYELMCEKGIDEQKMSLIYNGITNLQQKKNFGADADIEELIKLRDMGVKIIGCVGTICKRKNQVLLLEAFKNLLKTEAAVCVFVGEGELAEELRQKADVYGILDKVRFWGYKEDSSRFYKLFSCIVLPSLSEGHPITTVECFRERVLFIGSDIPCMMELVKQGENGYLFESNNSISLVETLTKALKLSDEEASAITERAYVLYREYFTLEAMVNNYIDLYKEVLR